MADVMMTKAPMIVSPSKLKWLGLLAVAGLMLCATAAHAQQFSADLVLLPHDGVTAIPAGKVLVSNDKVRLETPDLADGFFLTDAARPTAYFVRPVAQTFMDARQSSRLPQLFVPVDPGDPCRQWQAMAQLASGGDSNRPWRCERVGEEIIDGHHTITYRAISPTGRDIVGWIDPELKFPLRIKMEDGATITVENIQEGPPPARLFEIPTSFRKFDPQALIDRIKQSDVWVDKPRP
jgi:hypothetical protein